jgi:hypothetical protein
VVPSASPSTAGPRASLSEKTLVRAEWLVARGSSAAPHSNRSPFSSRACILLPPFGPPAPSSSPSLPLPAAELESPPHWRARAAAGSSEMAWTSTRGELPFLHRPLMPFYGSLTLRGVQNREEEEDPEEEMDLGKKSGSSTGGRSQLLVAAGSSAYHYLCALCC